MSEEEIGNLADFFVGVFCAFPDLQKNAAIWNELSDILSKVTKIIESKEKIYNL